jgi:radical SAM superfamily enzyme YgiQ (UPF0313 family)
VIDSTNVDKPGRVEKPLNPYLIIDESVCDSSPDNDQAPSAAVRLEGKLAKVQQKLAQRLKTVIRLPSYNDVSRDPVLYAHASRVLHLETNPGNARAMVQNPRKWIMSSASTTRGCRIRPTAMRGFPLMK